jgi:protein-tyrosine phosphatase
MRAEIFWAPARVGCRLAILPRPRGGDWLFEELAELRGVGLDVLVSLLTAEEVVELELSGEPAACAAVGIAFLSLPIADRGVPEARAAEALVSRLVAELALGRAVGVHCRFGVGRSSLIAASALSRRGVAVDEAFQALEEARGRKVPDVEEQRRWVERFAAASLR